MLIVERLEAGVGVGLEKAGEVREVLRRILTAAIGTVEVGGGRRRHSAERPVVADIDP